MKKFFALTLLALATLTLSATNYNYKAAPTEVTVDDQSYGTTYKYKLTIKQNCLNTSDNKTYAGSAELHLIAKEHKLEGTYSVADGSINADFSAVYYGNNTRRPNTEKSSTITISKTGDYTYAITAGELNVQNMQGSNQYRYNYVYADGQWSATAPFEFTFGTDPNATEPKVHYDMVVKGIHAERSDSDYGTVRYYFVLSCEGTRRDNGVKYNYEVQMDLFPSAADLSGTYSTSSGSNILMYADTYVKWLKSDGTSKVRYIAKDSTSTITIKANGSNQYAFTGGTLICQDVTTSVMGDKKTIDQTLYYHFSGSYSFGFDENNTSSTFTPTGIEVIPGADGYTYRLSGTVDGIDYTVVVETETTNFTGTFTTTSGLSTWTKVERGTTTSNAVAGSTITVTNTGGNNYTIYGTILCENGKTYEISSFPFTYGTSTALPVVRQQEKSRKVVIDGTLYIERDGVRYNAFGAQL